MKVLTLSSLNKNEMAENIHNVLKMKSEEKSWFYEIIHLKDKRIEYCTGCGYCGDTEPGICVKKDDMQEIMPEIIQSDLLVFVTNVSFGGYNSELKKVVDRFMGMNSSLYTIYKGELHHQNRYSKAPSLLTIGILGEENHQQEQIFKSLTERNAVNFFSPHYAAVTLVDNYVEETIEVKVRNKLNELEVVS